MSVAPPAYCLNCRHYLDFEPFQPEIELEVTDQVRFTCAAFDSIPDEILAGDARHDRPYPGDRGIRFEAVDRSGPKP